MAASSTPSTTVPAWVRSGVWLASAALLTAWAVFAWMSLGPVRAQAKPPVAGVASGPALATFAGGCFWCTEADFDKVPGVLSTTSGYIGGPEANPTYEQVSSGRTGHTEAVQVVYDPTRVSYEQLVEYFWRSIDPTTPNRQFCDVGPHYRSGIFTHNDEQHRVALASRERLSRHKPFPDPIVTEVTRATTFYPAEAYHQNYHQENPLRYRYYRQGCGRDARLQQLWGGPPKPP